jgi:hypothetical protein
MARLTSAHHDGCSLALLFSRKMTERRGEESREQAKDEEAIILEVL